MTFGEKIKKERRDRGLDQTEFGKLIGVSLRTVVTYEKGQGFPRCRGDYKRIADALNVNVNYLLEEDEEANNASPYAYTGKIGAQRLMKEVNGLFSGGELSEEDMDELVLAIQQAYVDAKRKKAENV